MDREIIHTPDMLTTEAKAEFPSPSANAERLGIRTALIAPLPPRRNCDRRYSSTSARGSLFY
jgi:hypothetical protein